MKWEDVGLVLSARKFSERDALVALLTHRYGLWRALVKGGSSMRYRATYEPGNLLLARWNARLEEHLGSFSCEMLEQNAAVIMQDRCKLAVLSSLCALLEGVLPEREPHPVLFAEVQELIGHGCTLSGVREDKRSDTLLASYIRYEMLLLAESGYGLDVSRCTVTGSTENLLYVSPKTGRAVCREAGAPYREKLLPLPPALRDTAHPPLPSGILDALRVTGYFLLTRLYEPRGRKLPAARDRLLELIAADALQKEGYSSAMTV